MILSVFDVRVFQGRFDPAKFLYLIMVLMDSEHCDGVCFFYSDNFSTKNAGIFNFDHQLYGCFVNCRGHFCDFPCSCPDNRENYGNFNFESIKTCKRHCAIMQSPGKYLKVYYFFFTLELEQLIFLSYQ